MKRDGFKQCEFLFVFITIKGETMKVEEAKEKICPFILGGRFEWEKSGEPLHIKCIYGKCMAWVWDNTTGEVSTTDGYCVRLVYEA